MSHTSRKQVNRIPLVPLARYLLLAFVMGTSGLCFVRFKNQQHLLGEETRKLERELTELRSENETLVGKITQMTGPAAIQRSLKEGRLDLVPITDGAIARISERGFGDVAIQVAQTGHTERLMR